MAYKLFTANYLTAHRPIILRRSLRHLEKVCKPQDILKAKMYPLNIALRMVDMSDFQHWRRNL